MEFNEKINGKNERIRNNNQMGCRSLGDSIV